jgi:retron-type reverse transcriptase
MPAAANDTRDTVRHLQNTLYLAAKRSPNRRFHALYDKVHCIDVLERAWQQVKANQGSPGVDAQTIEAIEAGGVAPFLAAVQTELREDRYRPQAVRRAWIPKPGKPEKRPLGIATVKTAWSRRRRSWCWKRSSRPIVRHEALCNRER